MGIQFRPSFNSGLNVALLEQSEWSSRGQNLRCDLDLWLRLAQLSRLSGLAADRLAALMVVETFIRLRVLIPASAEAAVQMDRTCAVG